MNAPDDRRASDRGQPAPPAAPCGECLFLSRAAQAADVPRLLQSCADTGLAARWIHPATLPPPRVEGRRAARTVLLPRLPSGTPAEMLLTLDAWERSGAVVLNPASALRLTHDKATCLATLAAAGLAVPPTLCLLRDGPTSLASLPGAERAGQLFVVKPATGNSGRGVTVGLTREAAAAAAAAFADASGPVLVQPLLGGGIDRRLFVVGEEIVAAMERRPAPGVGRGNLAYGAEAAAFVPTDAEAELARSAMRVLGLHVAGVDLLRDGDRPLVLEVNSSPGLAGISRATGRDVTAAITAFMARLSLGAPGAD
jgi:ribosomal protein S6--L-glutamate ligase